MTDHKTDSIYMAVPFLSEADCQTILSMCKEWHKCDYFRTGEETYTEDHRVVDICRQQDIFEFVQAKVGLFGGSLNMYDFDLFKRAFDFVSVYRYPTGGFFNYHVDTGMGSERKLSVVINLNPSTEFKGGDLRFHDDAERSAFADQKVGTAVVFPSYTAHSVDRVTEGVRYSLAFWFKGPPLR